MQKDTAAKAIEDTNKKFVDNNFLLPFMASSDKIPTLFFINLKGLGTVIFLVCISYTRSPNTDITLLFFIPTSQLSILTEKHNNLLKSNPDTAEIKEANPNQHVFHTFASIKGFLCAILYS